MELTDALPYKFFFFYLVTDLGFELELFEPGT
jgi:hypothetical protein